MALVQEKNKIHEPSCVHHWLIEEAKGPISEGCCRKCGKVKNFENSVGKTSWSNGIGNRDKSRKLAA